MSSQGWEFAHLLISLKSNEQLWANRSGRSEEMSEWAIRSKKFGKKSKILFLVYDIKKNLKKWANRSFSLISSFSVSNLS